MIPIRPLLAATSMLASAWMPVPHPAPAPALALTRTPAHAPGLIYEFTSQTVIIGPTGDTLRSITIRGHAALLGDKARIDIDDAGHLGNRLKGAYFLSSDSGKKMIWVVPSKKQYYDVNAIGANALNAVATNGGTAASIQASNVHIDVKKLGPGPVLQGHKTVHYRMTQSMDLTTAANTSHHEVTIDYDCAPDLQKFVNPFLNNGESPLAGGAKILGDEYATQLHKAQHTMAKSGAPLRTVTTTKISPTPGTTVTTISTMEITSLKQSQVNDTIFAVPPGYTKFHHPSATDTNTTTSPTPAPPPPIDSTKNSTK